jgi:hypothetical protein
VQFQQPIEILQRLPGLIGLSLLNAESNTGKLASSLSRRSYYWGQSRRPNGSYHYGQTCSIQPPNPLSSKNQTDRLAHTLKLHAHTNPINPPSPILVPSCFLYSSFDPEIYEAAVARAEAYLLTKNQETQAPLSNNPPIPQAASCPVPSPKSVTIS